MSFIHTVPAVAMAAIAISVPAAAGDADPVVDVGPGVTMPEAMGSAAATHGPLYDAIRAADLRLFHVSFDLCDPDALATMVTDDLEFFHDRNGVVATSGAQFIRDFRDHCRKQKAGTDFLSRRELIPGSLRVYPLGPNRAFEMGSHRFFKLTPGAPDQLTETALFAHVWAKVDGSWRLERVISYDHKDAPKPMPR
ncbi:nuclear transport factor 2 family protein [Kordiimonas marina]|uniref:nuclear transport factor 2 family protein n=1 Tax=Kordiimonas marina TaxID=2872312 RepID=UPI001FF0F41E|nr:nuclear transport factor 2 family protein [Kordiimonas marina]MCJ9428287.1 nuclear transport factor 2 family protein [Kordiimonas marina]